MASRDELQALMDRGLALVPVRPGSKAPDTPDWTARTFTLDDFDPSDNVGIKLGTPSTALVDIDCDSDLTAQAAHELLPHTLGHGRPSRPHSHYFFRVIDEHGKHVTDLDGTKAYRNFSGASLAEVRSTGGQTIVPPSTHPSGEVLTWTDVRRPILNVTRPELTQMVNGVMVAALLAEHWPAGRRHEFSGHVAGLLARYVPDTAKVERIVRCAARLAHDEEAEDRARFARETAAKYEAGGKVTGAPMIRDILGDAGRALIQFVRKVYGDEGGTDLLEGLNERYFVTQLGASMVVGVEPRDPSGAVDFMPFTEFQKKYCNQFLGKRPLGAAWLAWPDRRTYEKVTFAPPGSTTKVYEDDYNLWRGFVCDPMSGDPRPHIERYLDHIARVICNDDEVMTHYVLDLLADCAQCPGDPPGKSLVLRGMAGLGKSLCVEAFGGLFGRQFLSVNHREQLTGSFNGHLSGRVVVFADDAVWGGHKEDAGTLRYLVTQRMLTINRKHVDRVAEPNYIHLFLSTNEKWAWPAGNRERRGVILDVRAERPRDYFNALVAEIHAPTFYPALLRFLLDRPVDRDALLAGVPTEALQEQQDLSAPPEQQWWRMILEDGTWRGEPWPEFLSQEAIYDQFVLDMGSQRGAGVGHRGTRMQLTRRLKDMLPPSTRISTRQVKENVHEGIRGLAPEYVSKVRKVLVLPPLAQCRSAFDTFTGSTHTWPAEWSAEEQTKELEL